MSSTEAKEKVKSFVKEGLEAGVTRDFYFDSDRGSSVADLCRPLPGGGQACIKVAMESKALFAYMQQLGFFCQLPQDPTKTHINCEKIPS